MITPTQTITRAMHVYKIIEKGEQRNLRGNH